MTANVSSSGFEYSTWQWQGHNIRYCCQGQGTPLVLLHGFGASIGHWRKNIPVLAEAGYQVYALDLLGFGASDKPALAYTMDLWQSLVQDFWHGQIRRPAVFIGNSIGGLLALMLLANSPEIAQGGILLNPAGGLNHRPDELNPLLQLGLKTFAQLVNSQRLGPWLFNQVRQPSRIRQSLKQVYCNPAAITDELVELIYRPACDPGAQQVFASILTAPAGPRPEELLPHLRSPLLVLWGEADPWTPISAASPYRQYMATHQIELIPIPNTGHCPHDEDPTEINARILDWLQQQTV